VVAEELVIKAVVEGRVLGLAQHPIVVVVVVVVQVRAVAG
jgi:hypothetical protein